jgi:hypothetical protein
MVAAQSTQHTPSVSGPRQQAWIRALDRARLVSTRKPTYVISLDAYRVYSARADAEYMVHPVEVDGVLTYECECAAVANGNVCWHAALIAALPYEIKRRAAHRAELKAARAEAMADPEIAKFCPSFTPAALVAQDRTETGAYLSRIFPAPAFRPTASTVLSGSDPLAAAFN